MPADLVESFFVRDASAEVRIGVTEEIPDGFTAGFGVFHIKNPNAEKARQAARTEIIICKNRFICFVAMRRGTICFPQILETGC